MGQVSLWVELLRAIPSIVTAATAIVGVIIAKAGLEKWRKETIGKRKAELASANVSPTPQFEIVPHREVPFAR